ncbi:MAG: hypothetical protein M3032_10505 [Verrucomicrobiota bacterium]|nr:hypothetical protein [Verrucomicrobiota bacterium]
MRTLTLLVCLSAIALGLHAQTVSTTAPESEAVPMSSPPPLLSFVSPDASLVARPEDARAASLFASPPPMQLKIEAAREINGAATTSFRATAPNIFVRWRGENLPVGADVRVAWVAEDVGDLVEPDFIVDQNRTAVETPNFSARFTLSRPRDGWAPGKYRVDLYVDDELKDTLGVTISE